MPSRRIAAFLALLALLTVALATTAFATVQPRTADAEAPLTSQFDQINQSVGTLGIVDGGYGDAHAIRASYSGGGQNGFARGIFNVDWREGDDVFYSAAFFLPQGFKAAMQGQVAIMRWDDYGAHPEAAGQGGVVINGGDKRARLVLNQMPAATQVQLGESFELPEGRWFHLEVHQRLSEVNGEALTELYVDGQKVGSSTVANSRGRVINHMRFGYVNNHRAGGASTLWYDRVSISDRQLGPKI